MKRPMLAAESKLLASGEYSVPDVCMEVGLWSLGTAGVSFDVASARRAAIRAMRAAWRGQIAILS